METAETCGTWGARKNRTGNKENSSMKRILVVDNDLMILEFMKDLLAQQGHEVTTAEDGISALDALEGETPDVIFVDLVMPNIDGKRLCKIIRSIQRLNHTHVVILSSIAAEEAVDLAELGANACIAKGPMDQMSRHVLAVMEASEGAGAQPLTRGVMGAERSRPRAITEELLSVKQHFEVILEKMSEGILEITAEGRIIYANRAAISLIQIPEESLLGSRFAELFDKDDHQRVAELLESETTQWAVTEDSPLRLRGRDMTLYPLPMESHDATAVLILNDVSDRKRAEEMVRSERDKFQGVLNAIGEGMFIINRDYAVEYQNEVYRDRFGSSEGRKCHEAFMQATEPCDFCRARETMESGKAQHLEAIHGDGRSYGMGFSPFVDLDGKVKVIVMVRDITEEKRLQAEAMRAAHLASLGELSAGVAHEINNPINGIINYAEILKDRSLDRGEDSDIPVRIIKESERIAQIVQNLLTFSRDHKEDPSPVHLGDVIADALQLIGKGMAKDGIEVVLGIPPGLPRVKGRPQEIQQVFLNLLSNARYALNDRFPRSHPDKILEIRGEIIQMEEQDHVRITFRDQGRGIPSGILEKIFNPFFSTKPKGEGTGLGLSISHGIIKGHSGRVWFESEEGAYTKAVVELPVATDGN
jgi:PAS domain S-box-containing protein